MPSPTPSPVGLIPAAGASRRMGQPKLVLPFRGTTVLGATVAALREGGAGRVCVVIRPDDDALRDLLDGEPGMLLAVNPEPERGMLSSILAGLEAIGDPGAPLLVCPGDLPALSPDSVARVLAALPPGGLAVPVHRKKRGHPLAIAPARAAEIPGLDPAVGLRRLLDRHPERIVEVPVDDPGSVRDVDTPEDYRRLTRLEREK